MYMGKPFGFRLPMFEFKPKLNITYLNNSQTDEVADIHAQLENILSVH